MEFLDICLTKSRVFLFHAIHSHFYWRVLKKTIFLSGFKNPYKFFLRNSKTRVFSWIAFCRTEKWGQKTRQFSDSSLWTGTSLKMASKNSLLVLPHPLSSSNALSPVEEYGQSWGIILYFLLLCSCSGNSQVCSLLQVFRAADAPYHHQLCGLRISRSQVFIVSSSAYILKGQ